MTPSKEKRVDALLEKAAQQNEKRHYEQSAKDITKANDLIRQPAPAPKRSKAP